MRDPIEKALAEPWLIAPSAVSEIDNWGEPTDAAKQKDALIRELMDGRHRDLDKMREMKALIRELAAALTEFLEFGEYAYSHGREALAKAKAAGFEP